MLAETALARSEVKRPTIDEVMKHYNETVDATQNADAAFYATLQHFHIRTWDDIEYPNVIEDADKDTCYRCKEPISRDEEFRGSDNGLELDFRGGYGEFIDNLYTITRLWLCHECGHALGDFLGLDVHNWHTHKTDSGQHADHHDRADTRTHTYVECCDRYALLERTYWDDTMSGRYCRPGMGCQSPVYTN